MASESNNNSNKNHIYYLVSASIDADGKIIEKTALPIRDTFIAIDDIEVKGANLDTDANGVVNGATENDDSLQIYLTNPDGVISNFNTGKQTNLNIASLKPFETGSEIKTISQKAKLYFPPTRLLTYVLATKGYDHWLAALRGNLKKIIDSDRPIAAHFPLGDQILDEMEKEPKSYKVENLFDTPLDAGGNSTEQAYRLWYEKNKSQTIKAIVLPRVRAVSIVFSSSHYLGAEIRIFDARGDLAFYDRPVKRDAGRFSQVNEIQDENLNTIGYGAVLYDADFEYDHTTNIKEQIYRIEVTVAKDNANTLGLKSNVYSLAERLRFDIVNLAGEFDLINGDAISLEEALVKQFPVFYRNIVQQANVNADPLTPPSVEDGLFSYTHSLQTNLERTKISSSILGAKSGQQASYKIGKLIVNSLEPIGGIKYNGATFSDSVNIAFGVYEKGKEISEVIKNMADEGSEFFIQLEAIKDDIDQAKSAVESLKASKSFRYIENYAVAADTKIEDFIQKVGEGTVGNTVSEGLKKLALPERFENLFNKPKQKLLKLNRVIQENKITDKVSKTLDVVSLFNSYYGFSIASDKHDDARSKLTKYSEDYAYKVHLVDPKKDVIVESTDEIMNAIEQLNAEYGDDVQVMEKGDYYYVDVTFSFDKSEFIADESLENFANILSGISSDFTLTLVGHTCKIGTEQYNLNLSLRRAISVKNKLKELGLPDNITLRAEGRGETEQRYKENAKNRRVEAVIKLERAKSYFPSREGMDSLERFRSVSVLTRNEKNKATTAAVVNTIDMALGVPTTNPYIAGAQVLWLLGNVLVDAAEFTEKLIFSEDFLALVAKNEKVGIDSINNQVLLLEGQENNKTVDGSDYLEFQLRLRAEALSGLMRLLLRCSIETGDWIKSLKSDDNLISEFKHREDFSYSTNFAYYKIDEYIETFILNDGWELPLKPFFPVRLDEFWIQKLENDIRNGDYESPDPEEVESFWDKIFSFESLERVVTALALRIPAFAIPVAAYEIYKLYQKSALSDGWAGMDYIKTIYSSDSHAQSKVARTAKFQECFPIHHLASKEVDIFADKFKADLSGLTKDSYAYTSIKARRFGSHTNQHSGWSKLEEFLNSSSGLSPLHQIRICIVLDSKNEKVKELLGENNSTVIPVQVNPVRIDSMPDMEGPTVSGFITQISENILHSEEIKILTDKGILKKKEDHDESKGEFVQNPIFGAVLFPHFMYGVSKIHGTKPMASDFDAWLSIDEDEELAEGIGAWQGKWRMEYSYEVTLAYKQDTKKTIEYEPGKESFEMSLDTSRIHTYENVNGLPAEKRENFLFNKEFLKAGKKAEPLPRIFDDQEVYFLLKYGTKPNYVYSHKTWINTYNKSSDVFSFSADEYGWANLGDFRWSNRAQMLILVVCDKVDPSSHESKGFKWKTVSAKAQLNKVLGPRIWKKGPRYDMTLNYLGDVTSGTEKLTFNWDEDGNQPDARFEELSKYFDDQKTLELLTGMDPAESEFEQFIDEKFNVDKQKSIFAGYVDLDYQSLTGRMRQGVKPFYVSPEPTDSMLEGGWRLGVEVTSQGESGLNQTKAKGTYSLPVPSDFMKENAHWYIEPDQEQLELAKSFMEHNKEIADKNLQNGKFDPTLPSTPWVQWQSLSKDGEFWTKERHDFVENWLQIQTERRFLPAGDLVAFDEQNEA